MAICCDHSVFFYITETDFPEALNHFFSAAVKNGSPMVLIMTPEHRQVFSTYLRKNFLDPKAMKSARLLVELDAEQTLAQFWDGQTIDAGRFKEAVGGLLRDTQAHHAGRATWAYGEMVDCLVKQGHPRAAIELEHRWNDLAKELSFSLLCGYGYDPLGADADAEFVISACQAHSRVLPLPRDAVQSEQIHNALTLKIGATQGNHFWNTARAFRPDLPEAFSALLWLRQFYPRVAQSVYDHIRCEQTA